MTVTSIQRDWGPNISIVRMICDSALEDIVAPGWLATQMPSIDIANRGPFQFTVNDVCLISYPQSQLVPDGLQSKGFFYVFPDFSSVNPMTPILPNLQGITAFAAGGQTGATQLNVGINVVTVAGGINQSVKLPTDVLGQTVVIFNNTAFTIAVYPAVGDFINGSTLPNQPIAMTTKETLMFIGVQATNWGTIS